MSATEPDSIFPFGLIEKKSRFRRRLMNWYDRNGRDLPWRRNHAPYRVWISEIMLQQTRVGAVLEHYHKFLRRFPTVQDLARAREASVLAVWSGLGYYRRARMLRRAAKTIVTEFDGKFPSTSQELRGLDGVGRYTAAAIASIAFGETAAVVDGNVERVLGRLAGRDLPGEEQWQAAAALLSPQRPGDFNQAMMELGATVCLPRQPKCPVCPVFGFCVSRGEPVTAQKGKRQQKREISYAFVRRNGAVFLVQRPKHVSLMPGMWELPEGPSRNSESKPWLRLRHSITVTDYAVRVVRSSARNRIDGRWVQIERVSSLPLTGLARKILRAAKVI
jgi:A/G-specific adenine glycosylase